jgi:hypothetical protein
MYAILRNNHFRPTSKQKLMTMFELTENDIKQIYKLPFKTMKNCKFQWLQYRTNHFRLTTNTFLYKIKIKQDPLCSFCKKENKNMIYLWECENVQILLEALYNWTLKNGNFTLNYNKKTFTLGYHKEKNLLISNTILLAIKYYIYTCRCLSKNLALTALIYILQELYSIERIMAIKQENLEVFNNSWNCWEYFITK